MKGTTYEEDIAIFASVIIADAERGLFGRFRS